MNKLIEKYRALTVLLAMTSLYKDVEDIAEKKGRDPFEAFGLNKDIYGKTADTNDNEDNPEDDNDEGEDPKPDPKLVGLYVEPENNEPPEEDDHTPTNVYKINKKEYTRAEVEALALDEIGTDVSKMDKEKADKVLAKFVKMQNVDEGNKKVNEIAQSNARERKELERENKEIERKQSEIAESIEELKLKRESLESKIAEYEEKIEDTYDENVKTALITKKTLAEEKLEDIDDDEKKLKKREKEVAGDAHDQFINSLVYDLQSEFPEDFVTGRPLLNVLADIEAGKLKEDDEDIFKANTLSKVMEDYAKQYGSKQHRPTINIFYKTYRRLYNPAYVAPSTPGTIKNKLDKAKDKQAKDLATKQGKDYTSEPQSRSIPHSTANGVKDPHAILSDLNMSGGA